MTKVKLIHVGLGGWGTQWAQEILPSVESVESNERPAAAEDATAEEAAATDAPPKPPSIGASRRRR